MKKILLTLMAVLFMSVGAQANAVAKHFEQEGKNIYYGGVIGDTMIFLYKGMDAKDISDPVQLSAFAKIAEKKVCGKKGTKAIVDNGIKVIFVYQDKAATKGTIVDISSCKDYTGTIEK